MSGIRHYNRVYLVNAIVLMEEVAVPVNMVVIKRGTVDFRQSLYILFVEDLNFNLD